MLNRWPALQSPVLFMALFTALFTVLLLSACTDPDINIPDRNSLGMSNPLIEIYSPLNGSTLPANTDFTLDYAILRSEDGHHIKIFVDKKRPMSVYKLEGKHRMHGLPAGQHRIQIIEYTKDGRKTGGNITLQLTMAETGAGEPADAGAVQNKP
jgi:hypothetical protein